MAGNTKLWWSLFVISLFLILFAAAIHTCATVSLNELIKGRLVVRSSPVIDIVVSGLGFINWILLPLSIIMLYTSLGREKRWYEVMNLYGFILTLGIFYLITSLIPMMNLGDITEALFNIFLGKFLYLIFVPLLVILFFSLFESVRIIKKLE
jgi:hypothetical protein